MAYYGYHRISTKEQHLDRGIIEIKRFCENQKIKLESIFTDKITGKNFDRPRYTVLVEDVLRVGDTLIITELDRLGRNKQEILKQLRFLEEKGVRVMVLELPTTLFDLSQMENNLAKMMIETINNMMIAMETGIRSADIPCIEWSCMHGKTIILEETKRGDLYKKVNGTFPKISTQSLRIMKLLHRKQGKIFTKSNEYYVRKISCAWGMPGFRIHSFRDYRRKIEMGITAGVQVPRIIPL